MVSKAGEDLSEQSEQEKHVDVSLGGFFFFAGKWGQRNSEHLRLLEVRLKVEEMWSWIVRGVEF